MNGNERLQQGQAFGRYQIVRLIGEGGMGTVYEAIHPALKRRFAIKTLLPAYAQNEEARVRFLREGEAASMINHPNVVTVSDVGTENGIPYLVMDLLEGQTLGDFLAGRGPVGVEQSVDLLLPVISAVATGHDSGVIHRDLKPANIFLAKGRRGEVIPKVLDFGVSKLTSDDAAITRTMTVLGTASYMSPEQARGARQVDFQSDQYALGLILYEMLTGSRAHPGDNPLEVLHNVASGLIRPARELKPDLSHDIEAILDRMLAANPRQRFPSLSDCGRAMLPFAGAAVRATMTGEFGPPPADRAGPTASLDPVRTGAPAAPAPAETPARPEKRDGARQPMVRGAERLSDTTLRQAAAASEAGQARQGSSKVKIAAAVGVAALGGFVVWAATRPGPPHPVASVSAPVAAPAARSVAPVPEAPVAPAPPAPAAVPHEIHSVPADAEIALDDRPPTHGRLELVLPLAGATHRIRVSAPGFVTRVIEFGAAEEPPTEVRLDRAPPHVAKKVDKKVEPKAETHGPSEAAPPALPRTAKAPRPHAEPASPPLAPPAATPKRGSNNALILK